MEQLMSIFYKIKDYETVKHPLRQEKQNTENHVMHLNLQKAKA
jgi:hypothetical protein